MPLGEEPGRGPGSALRRRVLIVPEDVVTLTVSVAVLPLPPPIVNVHVGPAATEVTVNVLPDCAIVATDAEQVIDVTLNGPE